MQVISCVMTGWCSVKRTLILCLLTSMFLLLSAVSAQDTAQDITFEAITTQDMIVNGVVDKPNVSIVVLDRQTNKLIGQGSAKADSNGTFASHIVFSNSLKDYNELILDVTNFDDYGNKTNSKYRFVLNCWTLQQVGSQDPCGLMVSGPWPSDETMTPG
jgi:hypothetical protein